MRVVYHHLEYTVVFANLRATIHSKHVILSPRKLVAAIIVGVSHITMTVGRNVCHRVAILCGLRRICQIVVNPAKRLDLDYGVVKVAQRFQLMIMYATPLWIMTHQ